MQHNRFRAAGLHLGYQFAACFLIVSRIAIGDREQNNANGLSAFLRKIEKALSGSAFKTSDFGSCVRSVGIFERKGKTLPAAFGDDETKHICVRRTLVCKADFHEYNAF